MCLIFMFLISFFYSFLLFLNIGSQSLALFLYLLLIEELSFEHRMFFSVLPIIAHCTLYRRAELNFFFSSWRGEEYGNNTCHTGSCHQWPEMQTTLTWCRQTVVFLCQIGLEDIYLLGGLLYQILINHFLFSLR